MIGYLARSGIEWHADDLRALIGDPPGGGRQLSAAFALAVRRELITPVGATIGEDGRLLRTWRGISR
jgi:hypothetical protein